ncbi:MAG: thiamine pyrophosphate-binding protein [Gemmatimonadota bacterium]
MPVSVTSSRLLHEALKACGVRVVSALPETWLVPLVRALEEDPEIRLVHLAREEEGVGIGMGAQLAGTRSALLMQNHGFLAAINGLVSGAQLYRIPLLMLITYRGEAGERDPWHRRGGAVTPHVLDALRIPYELLEEPAHVERRMRDSFTLAETSERPAALLLRRGLMWEE